MRKSPDRGRLRVNHKFLSKVAAQEAIGNRDRTKNLIINRGEPTSFWQGSKFYETDRSLLPVSENTHLTKKRRVMRRWS